MARLALTLVLGLAAAPAWAQPRFPGEEEPPPMMDGGLASKKEKGPSTSPLALALSLSIEATTWTKIGVSTSPVIEVSRLMRGGHYRLEILELVLMAREAGRDLAPLVARRDKGESLRDIAKSLSMDPDEVYERALRMTPAVEAWERRVSSVGPLERDPREGGPPPSPSPGDPRALPGMEDKDRDPGGGRP